jgi:hypothetical protein
MYICIVLYVLIVFSLHRESLKLILAMNPSPRRSNHFSYVLCGFTYRMVQSDIILLYIRSCIWEIIYVVGPSVVTVQTPRMPFPCDGSGRS